MDLYYFVCLAGYFIYRFTKNANYLVVNSHWSVMKFNDHTFLTEHGLWITEDHDMVNFLMRWWLFLNSNSTFNLYYRRCASSMVCGKFLPVKTRMNDLVVKTCIRTEMLPFVSGSAKMMHPERMAAAPNKRSGKFGMYWFWKIKINVN